MPNLPTRDDLGQRPSLNPQVAQPSIVRVDATQQAKAYESLGNDLKVFGTGMTHYQNAKDRSAFVDAKSLFLKRSVEAQSELENDPDYSTYGERYQAKMADAKKEAIEIIGKSNTFGTSAFGNQYTNDLQGEINLHEAQGLARLADVADRKEGDFERGKLDTLLTDNSKALLQTGDEAVKRDLMDATAEAIDLRATRGFISQEAAVKLKQGFAENYATQRVALIPTNQQMALIKPQRSKDGSVIFPETGNWTDALSTETKIKIYNNAQAEVKTQINNDINDVEQAQKLGLHIPPAKLQSLSSRAYAAGMTDVGNNINKFIKVQGDSDKFATLSMTQQQQELSTLRASIEKDGKLQEIDKFTAFSNILETKAKYLKEDPYAYYSAHGVISAPQPLDITNPAAIEQNLQARRVENQKVKNVEGDNFEMPILTRQEIDQLKTINQTGSADQVGAVVFNIGSKLQPKERATLARQFAKEQSPTLAVAMSMNNQKDAIDIIAGSKLKGEVSPTNLRTETSSKLTGLVLDPEKNEMFHSAISDAYKKKAFDAGNVEKDVDTDLLDQAIEQVAGKAVEISPMGKTSKVFTYRDESGNFVDENDLEDTFNSIDDNVLKKTNGSLPVLPSGDVITTKEILKDTKLITFGNGQYVPYYEGVGYLTGMDGKPYVIDARKVKALTGNAPAQGRNRIQTRPSQSVFGYN